MTITIHNTTRIVRVNDVPARIWEGHTESGIPVHCYITLIAVHEENDLSQFEAELQEMQPPTAVVEEISLRMVL